MRPYYCRMGQYSLSFYLQGLYMVSRSQRSLPDGNNQQKTSFAVGLARSRHQYTNHKVGEYMYPCLHLHWHPFRSWGNGRHRGRRAGRGRLKPRGLHVYAHHPKLILKISLADTVSHILTKLLNMLSVLRVNGPQARCRWYQADGLKDATNVRDSWILGTFLVLLTL